MIKANQNDESFQVLNGILSTIKANEYPPQIVKRIPFNLRSQNGGNDFVQIELVLKTAGGDSRKSLTNSFTAFFEKAGLLAHGTKFKWSKEYFPID